jgi:16S rRNA (uracil1498-N3)-methyltransferase
MPTERFYADSPFSESVTLTGEEFHHLARVMRGKVGDSIELVNGKGVLAKGVIGTLLPDAAVINIVSSSPDSKKRPQIILAQAIPRQNHLEWIIEKGTELGVTSFWLFPGERSEKKEYNEKRLKHLTLSALKQCGRLFLPTIEKKPSLPSWKPLNGSLYFGDFEGGKFLPKPAAEPIIFFIGPEKGFSISEIGILQNNLKAQGVRLHENTLRTETAAVVALGLIGWDWS